jgi:membrane protein YdbS with pleckstrin-like domain
MSSAEPNPTPADREIAAESDLRGLDRRVVPYWGIMLLAQTAALLVALWVLERFLLRWLPIDLVVWAVLVSGIALAIMYPPAQYRSWGFQLRDGALYVRRGVWARTTSVIPHHRIQHVDTRRDPLERWLGIARVVVFTAGIRGAELAIPGIAADEAEALRDRLAELGGAGEGV